MAIQFLIHETNNSKDNLTFYVTGMHLINLLTQWTTSLSKVISVQRQKHGMKMSKKVKTTSDPYKFVNSKDTRDKLKIAAHNLQYTFERLDVQLVTAYAAAIMVYKNSQRSGVITNLTYKEYQMKKEKGTKYIIECTNHKTGPQGWAKLVINKKDFQHILNYKTLVRDKIEPKDGCKEMFFLTSNGSPYKQVYRKIIEAIKASNLSVTMPPPPSDH